jgi:pyridoxal phosphate enzyme (YggS family)
LGEWLTEVDTVAARLREVEERIALAKVRAGRQEEPVTLVAVTKTVPLARILAAYAAGVREFGENRVQEARAKAPGLPEDVRLHLIGPLQLNKVRRAVELFHVVQSVDRPELVERLARLREEGVRLPELLVEVNVGGEPQKAGVLPERLQDLIEHMLGHGLKPRGLMAIPPQGEPPRPYFRKVYELREALRAHVPELTELSMGMSQDFEVAVEEGATMVRIGTYLFGPRTTGG